MNPIDKKPSKPKFVFEEVDEVPFIAKGGLYDEYFAALEEFQRPKRGRKRKWVLWKKDSETRISLPMNWRDKFQMQTRQGYDKTGEKPLFNAYVRLKDEFTEENPEGGERGA